MEMIGWKRLHNEIEKLEAVNAEQKHRIDELTTRNEVLSDIICNMLRGDVAKTIEETLK